MPEQKKSPAVLGDSSRNLSEGNSALCCPLPPHSFLLANATFTLTVISARVLVTPLWLTGV